MQASWFIRLPLAAVLAGHGSGKMLLPVASAEILVGYIPVSLKQSADWTRPAPVLFAAPESR